MSTLRILNLFLFYFYFTQLQKKKKRNVSCTFFGTIKINLMNFAYGICSLFKLIHLSITYPSKVKEMPSLI